MDTAKIKKLREQLGMTQAEAATKAGFKSKQHWYNIEAGHTRNIELDTLEAVARALNVKAKDLLK